MHRQLLLILSLLILLPAHSNSLPEWLKIEKFTPSAGLKGYATPLFDICGKDANLRGKIVYVPSYVNNTSLLMVYMQDGDSELVKELKSLIEKAATQPAKERRFKTSMTISLDAYPEDIWTNDVLIGDAVYSLVGMQWSDSDEEDFLAVSIPLHACRSIKCSDSKNYANKFRKQLQESYVSGIEISFGFSKIVIPFDFPLNLVIEQMEEMYKSDI